ncbi:hypothetical protein EJ07DRAFT_159150 [Lizonia empirigonia]|nr:hypothetical protein EJ07DRAFT_159150 [Lizonia empirigonia]
MAASQLCNSSPLAYGDRQSLSCSSKIPQHRSNAAVRNCVHATTRAETRAAAPLDPFTFYKTYLDTNPSLLGSQEDFEPDDDSYTCHPTAAAHDAPGDDAQPQARGHTAAYKLAARLANRSNGVPLATIIEQRSYSTLNSHVSLLSVGRFSSLKTVENTSPNRGSRRRSRSLDEKALHDIQEDLTREHETCTVAAKLDKKRGAPDQASGIATPLTSYHFELQQSPSSKYGDELVGQDSRGVKRFIRGVLQNVRGVSRTRSRSSSMTHEHIIEHRESPPCIGDSRPQQYQQDLSSEFEEHQISNRNILIHVSEGAANLSSIGDQSGNYAILTPRVEKQPSSQSGSLATESSPGFESIPPVLPYRATTRSHEHLFSTPVACPGTRDVAQEDGTIQAPTAHNDTFDTSARNTFNGVPAYRGCLSSLREASSAREVFASQNASFCSTMSTSYSGTVLGIDLDLQHDFGYATRRSQSPIAPVWFTPQMAELERQASFSESPETVKAGVPTHAVSRSITSSALTSLLPLAAASGIVRPNYNTPKISFYSPSGNLIQPESSSPQGTSPSEYGGSPTITTSYYNKQNTDAASSSGSLRIRPPLVPMTTPPAHRTPLPAHLQHHHNYRHPEKSKISSRESSIIPKGRVKGCDGIVRENSLTPRSGIFYPNGKSRTHRSTKLIMHDLKAEAKFYKARFVTMVAAQSFAPSLPKGKTLQKRHVHNYDAYARKPHARSTELPEPREGGYGFAFANRTTV